MNILHLCPLRSGSIAYNRPAVRFPKQLAFCRLIISIGTIFAIQYSCCKWLIRLWKKENSNNEFGEKFAMSPLFSGIWICKSITFHPDYVRQKGWVVRALALRVTGSVFWPPVQALPGVSCFLSSNDRFLLKSVDLLTIPRLCISLLQYFDSLFILTGGSILCCRCSGCMFLDTFSFLF